MLQNNKATPISWVAFMGGLKYLLNMSINNRPVFLSQPVIRKKMFAHRYVLIKIT
jgi:hypothetical protein